MTPHHRQLSYYGYSFESFSTSSQPHQSERLAGHPPGWSGDVNTNVQWCSVVKTKLGSHRLLIGGEVDCVKGAYAESDTTYISLITIQQSRCMIPQRILQMITSNSKPLWRFAGPMTRSNSKGSLFYSPARAIT